MTTLKVSGLHCRLGTRNVLQGLSAAPLCTGQIVAIVGRNGVGKSTLLRTIAGTVACTATEMSLDGVDLRPMTAAARAASIRYLPQAAPASLYLTVRECLAVALNAHHRHPGRQARERIAATAAELELSPLLERHVNELSGGQKQLVWLAQALIHRPRALLLDEPLAALDPNFQHHVMKVLQRLARETGLLIMVVLHDLNMALRYADQALVLQDGKVFSQGAVTSALTPDTLAQAFRVNARIETCSRGTPFLIIDDMLTL